MMTETLQSIAKVYFEKGWLVVDKGPVVEALRADFCPDQQVFWLVPDYMSPPKSSQGRVRMMEWSRVVGEIDNKKKEPKVLVRALRFSELEEQNEEWLPVLLALVEAQIEDLHLEPIR